jgi:hypothetical protein
METRTKNNGLLLHSVGKKYITTKLLKGANIKITYKNSNTIVKISVYTNSSKIEKLSTSGIYHLTRPDFGKKYTGRIGIPFRKRYNEHLLSFKHQNPNWTFAKHLHDTGHSFEPMENIRDILHFAKKENLLTPRKMLHSSETKINNQRIYTRMQ